MSRFRASLTLLSFNMACTERIASELFIGFAKIFRDSIQMTFVREDGEGSKGQLIATWRKILHTSFVIL